MDRTGWKQRHRNAGGFTLAALIMGVVIVGLLTAFTITQVAASRERARVGVMQGDLSNLAVAQESYFYDFDVYTSDVNALRLRGLIVTAGAALSMNEATGVGWAATATHASTLTRCYLFVGAAAPVGSAVEEGTIACS